MYQSPLYVSIITLDTWMRHDQWIMPQAHKAHYVPSRKRGQVQEVTKCASMTPKGTLGKRKNHPLLTPVVFLLNHLSALPYTLSSSSSHSPPHRPSSSPALLSFDFVSALFCQSYCQVPKLGTPALTLTSRRDVCSAGRGVIRPQRKIWVAQIVGPPGEKGRGEKEKEPVAGLCGQRLGLAAGGQHTSGESGKRTGVKGKSRGPDKWKEKRASGRRWQNN